MFSIIPVSSILIKDMDTFCFLIVVKSLFWNFFGNFEHVGILYIKIKFYYCVFETIPFIIPLTL